MDGIWRAALHSYVHDITHIDYYAGTSEELQIRKQYTRKLTQSVLVPWWTSAVSKLKGTYRNGFGRIPVGCHSQRQPADPTEAVMLGS